MTGPLLRFHPPVRSLGGSQRGITGLETAIVLISFVVVASVFAFAALSTGLFTSDKAKETIKAGLSEARGTVQLKGSVIATASTTGSSGVVSSITFQVTSVAAAESVNMAVGSTLVKYTDDNQSLVLDESGEVTIGGIGSSDSDSLLERGEIFEITLPNLNTQLSPTLSTDADFIVEVITTKGAVLYLQRTTPISLETIQSLD
ncbi:MAG: archaellin/type IV pilin N-terminal domain-containing protein [Dehalococcoidia bacterium]